jgi:hypothetical protein
VYTINIDHLDSSGPITELDQAREAVAGTEITVIEADGIEGAWLAELPEDLIDEMRSLGSFDLQNGEYAIFGDWSE